MTFHITIYFLFHSDLFGCLQLQNLFFHLDLSNIFIIIRALRVLFIYHLGCLWGLFNHCFFCAQCDARVDDGLADKAVACRCGCS